MTRSFLGTLCALVVARYWTAGGDMAMFGALVLTGVGCALVDGAAAAARTFRQRAPRAKAAV